MTHTLYHNNSGSRWSNFTNGKKDKIKVINPVTKVVKSYTVAYYEAIGNFAVAYTRIKGKSVLLMEFNDDMYCENNAQNRAIKFSS